MVQLSRSPRLNAVKASLHRILEETGADSCLTWKLAHPNKAFKTLLASYILVVTSSTAQGGGGSFKNRKPIGEVGCCESGMAERIH